MEEKVKKISLHFHPFQFENKLHVFEKSIDGSDIKKRYLKGISSGIKVDQHGEIITKEAIDDFMRQANEGMILLYPDVHDIRASEDIGKLIKAEIDNNNNWVTTYQLYDQNDLDPAIYSQKLATIDTLWKQLNGLPPYDKPIQKGFSIEGIIPNNGIISQSYDGKRKICKIDLDGVVLCPRPAYPDSIANGIYKALNVLPPWTEEKIKKSLQNKLRTIVQEKEMKDEYFKKKFEIDNAFEETIEQIMSDVQNNKKERLEVIFSEYQDIMINLLLNSVGLFQNETNIEIPAILVKQENSEKMQRVLKDIASKIIDIKNSIKQNDINKTSKRSKKQ